MRIGVLAKRTGTTPDTVRYYETIGLLSQSERTGAGYRDFSEDDAERLRFILKAKRLGFTLDEIKGVLTMHGHGQVVCSHVLNLLDDKIERIDGLLAELNSFRAELANLKTWADAQGESLPSIGRVCAIIEQSSVAPGQRALRLLAERSAGPEGGAHAG